MLKLCYVDVSGKTGKFLFPNINKDMFNDILNYKSWTLNNESGMSGCFFDSWSNNASEKISYMNAIDTRDGVLVETKYGRGFIPVLVKHLEKLGFTLLENGKPFNMYSRCTKVKYPMFKIVLRNYQLNCCLKWQRDGIGAVKSPTGSGKTYIASNLMKNVGYKGLILVHTIDLVKQWEHSLVNSFGLTFKGNIGIFGGGKKLSDLGNKSVVIGTYQTAIKESKSGISNISVLDKMGFGMIIADECIPKDSIIFTDNGRFILSELKSAKNKNINIQLFDLDKQMLNTSKFDIFETKIEDVYTTKLENNKEINSTVGHRFLTKTNDEYKYKPIIECKNIVSSLIEPYGMNRDCIKARLFGYMLGDGHLSKEMSSDFYGKHEDLLIIQKDLKFLNYKVGKLTTREVKGYILQENGSILEPEGTVSTLTVKSPFGYHMKYDGYPIGNKTNVSYNIPQRIMNGNVQVKKEFLAGFLGAEGSALTTRLKRSFSHTRFSYNKRKDLVEISMKFTEQLEKLFNDCGVEISNIKIMDGNERKDGTTTKKVLFTVANSSKSLYNYTKIGFRYCKEKEIKNAITLNYLDYIEYEKQKRNDKYDFIIKRYKGNASRTLSYNNILLEKEIEKGNQFTLDDYNNVVKNKQVEERKRNEIKDDFEMTEGILSDWLHPHKNKDGSDMKACGRMPESVMFYDEWNKKVFGDMIILDVVSRKFRDTEQCYNITVHNENHNYLLDGFVSKNCHHVAADTFREVLNGLYIPHKLGLSATPRRLDNKEPEIFALVDNIKASVSIHGLIKDGYVVRPDFYNIYYIDNEILREVDKEKKGLAKSRKLKQLSAFSVRKYELLLKLIERLRRENKTFLLFTDFVKAAEVVEELLEKFICVNDNKFKVIRVAQEMSSEERSAIFNNVGIKYNQYNGLVFAKLGSEGIDISAVDCVINLSPSKSPVTFAQRTGRAMRPLKGKNHCEIYQFILKSSMEEGWKDFSFDEYQQEGFVQKNYIIR